MHFRDFLMTTTHPAIKSRLRLFYFCRNVARLATRYPENRLDDTSPWWKMLSRKYKIMVGPFSTIQIFIDIAYMSIFIDPYGHSVYAPLFAFATLLSLCSTWQWITSYPFITLAFKFTLFVTQLKIKYVINNTCCSKFITKILDIFDLQHTHTFIK